MLTADIYVKPDRFPVYTLLDDLVDPFKSASADKQNVRGINLNQFLMRMFSSALRRYVGNRSFYNLQKGLLYALAGHIPRYRRVLGLPGNLINLVNIDNPIFRPVDISISSLNNLQKNVLHILSHISSLSQRRRISDCKGNS